MAAWPGNDRRFQPPSYREVLTNRDACFSHAMAISVIYNRAATTERRLMPLAEAVSAEASKRVCEVRIKRQAERSAAELTSPRGAHQNRSMKKPLEGVRVIELAQIYAGPY